MLGLYVLFWVGYTYFAIRRYLVCDFILYLHSEGEISIDITHAPPRFLEIYRYYLSVEDDPYVGYLKATKRITYVSMLPIIGLFLGLLIAVC